MIDRNRAAHATRNGADASIVTPVAACTLQLQGHSIITPVHPGMLQFGIHHESETRMNTPLPTPLPKEPFSGIAAWLEQATLEAVQPNPNAMSVATIDADGAPSVRVVLLKQLVVDPGYVVFYTNYESRKARAIEACPRVACVLHWDTLGRQVRLEGRATVAPAADSDAYFASRDPASQLSAWGSDQSRPLASREALIRQTLERARALGLPDSTTLENVQPSSGALPRPPHWGGYRIWPEAVELWIEGAARVHDRARWERTLTERPDGQFSTGPWRGQRLQP
jgi:pyridoxamine 5'-phosphate oxidase